MKSVLMALTLLAIGLCMGCQTTDTEPTAMAGREYPPDFALVFTVQPQGLVAVSDPMYQPAQYVVESDRTLRVALGPGVHPDLYPPPTAILKPQEMVDLHRLVANGALMQAASEPTDDADIAYHLAITADGRTNRLTTTPTATPAAADLLRKLIALRGG